MSSPPPTPDGAREHDPAFDPQATVTVSDVSIWFGQKVALSELSCSFGPGVTGLLGPNGAGKTTLMRAITGLIPVNQGSIEVCGRPTRSDRRVFDQLALVSEDEAVPAGLSPRQLCRYVADLHRVSDRGAVDAAIDEVDLMPVADRPMDGFSKGMRQRAKIAAALVKDPSVLVLDEPLNGADPVQRHHLISLFGRMGQAGRTVIVSSHVLHEVETMAERVIVVVRGRLAAAGGRHAIRDAMHDVPRHVLIRSADARRLASALVTLPSVTGVTLRDADVTVSTSSAREFSVSLARMARTLSIRLEEVQPLDDSLESLFRDLVRS